MVDAYLSLQKMYSADDSNTEAFYFKNATQQEIEPSAVGLSCGCNYDLDSKRTGEKMMQIFVDNEEAP